MSYFKKMADILKPIKVGSVEVDIMDYTQREIGFREAISGLQNERYARLRIDGETMMSETPMEHRTNSDFVHDAHGDVLIGGLGLGMIIMAIQDKEDVHSVTVLEKSQDVIDAIQHQLPLNDRVKIICDDVFDWKPDKKYDCVYMDIWYYPSHEIYDEMKKLKRKYGHYLKSKEESPKRFNACWCEWYAKTGHRLL